MDWNTFSSVAGIIGVFIAMVALIIETRYSRIALQTETLISRDDKFNSSEIKQLRKIASQKLLKVDLQNDELGELLEFLGGICYLIHTKAIDLELASDNFSWWITRYWLNSEPYVKEVRLEDPFSWKIMEKVVQKLLKEEHKKGYRQEDYTKEKLIEFLRDESDIYIFQPDK